MIWNQEVKILEEKANNFLATEKIGRLMRKYSVPCILSLVVAALYNIVDQIFIANADYLGSYGNAANTVVFPLTVVALSIAVMIGDGCCAFVSISLGAGKKRRRTSQHRKRHCTVYHLQYYSDCGLSDFHGTAADDVRRKGQ